MDHEKGAVAGHAGDDRPLGVDNVGVVEARHQEAALQPADELVAQRTDAVGDHRGYRGEIEGYDTVWPEAVQVRPVPAVCAPNVSPVGSVSVKLTVPEVAEPPLLVTVTV